MTIFGKAHRRNRVRQAPDAGYSLVELLVVLAIIGLLTAVVAPRVLNYLSTARSDTARIQIKNVGNALELFYLDTGRYPTEEEGLAALSKRPPTLTSWNGPYLQDAESLKDPWGNPYLYRSPSQSDPSARVMSLGQDGKPGGEGDDRDLQ